MSKRATWCNLDALANCLPAAGNPSTARRFCESQITLSLFFSASPLRPLAAAALPFGPFAALPFGLRAREVTLEALASCCCCSVCRAVGVILGRKSCKRFFFNSWRMFLDKDSMSLMTMQSGA